MNETGRPSRVLVVGGSFDPPHRGHVEVARHVAGALAADRVLFVPASRNPLKPRAPLAPDEHRLAMLDLAARGLPGAELSRIEIERGGRSFFVETLVELRRRLGPDTELHFMIGADQALEFHRWKEWQHILDLAVPAVVLRPPWTRSTFGAAIAGAFDPDEARTWLARVVEGPLIDVSSTALRRDLAAGRDVGDRLDPAVAAYIAAHRLYGHAESAASGEVPERRQ